jgi:hypothetical protein
MRSNINMGPKEIGFEDVVWIQHVRFEVFTAVTMKNAVSWDVASCRPCVNRRFGGTYRLIFMVEKSASEEPASSGFFYHEN